MTVREYEGIARNPPRVQQAPRPAHARAVGETASQAGSVAVQRAEARERDDAGSSLATSNSKRENGDVDYDYSHLAPETDVGATDDVTTIPVKNLSYAFYKNDDEAEACKKEDQQLKVSNVLDYRHIRESTPI
ncbi:hypothetical protein WN51_12509 [Melipona quadrifasciata]|uniref:Uncharacterized protein n=1 Tax=Melipona quadrifasciata TaxID=166423 RepID=A0A0N0BHG5_9HYME|nr:hypothetical protein WN51_12509 [Melipona quadrifasciata]